MNNHRVSWEQEVPEVKKLLKSRNLNVLYCRRGRGTAGGWIEVSVMYPDDQPPMTDDQDRYTREYDDFRSELFSAVKYACGREDRHDDIMTDYFEVNILLTVISRKNFEERQAWNKQQKEKLKQGKTCKDCGTMGIYQKRKVGHRNVYLCPNCGKEWLN